MIDGQRLFENGENIKITAEVILNWSYKGFES